MNCGLSTMHANEETKKQMNAKKKQIILSLKIEIKIMHVSNWINKFNFRKMILTSHFSPIVNKSEDNTEQITEKMLCTDNFIIVVYIMNGVWNTGYVSRCVEFAIWNSKCLIWSEYPFHFNGFRIDIRHHIDIVVVYVVCKMFWGPINVSRTL